MLRVGLTGGIASGKSTVARIFRELGAHVIDADGIARDLVAPGSPALVRIIQAFGQKVLGPDGTLNRAALGAAVFADAGKRHLLEGILHPPILEEIDRRLAEVERTDPRGVAVVEAALIFEIGREAGYDAVVVVWAEEDQQRRRLMLRDRLSAEEVGQRLAAQMPLAKKRRRARFVVDNSGDPASCRADAERVYRELAQLARVVRVS